MATIPPPALPDRAEPAWLRRAVASGVGILLAFLATGQALFLDAASAGAAWAASGPANKASAGASLLHYSNEALPAGGRADLAQQALRRNPLNPQAVSYLALVARGMDDPARARALLARARGQGWQDEALQRLQYNDAIMRGDFARAMIHAEALLRQNMSAEPLAADFSSRLEDRSFRAAWLARFGEGGSWAERFLLFHASGLPDSALVPLLDYPEGGSLLPASLIAPLIRDGRPGLAAALLRARRGNALAIPRWEHERDHKALGWKFTDGFAPTVTGRLRRAPDPRVEPVSTLVALPPGRYRLVPVGAHSTPLESWRWNLSCLDSPAGDFTLLSSTAGIAVPTDCPLQNLKVSAEVAAYAGDPLPRVELASVTGRTLP